MSLSSCVKCIYSNAASIRKDYDFFKTQTSVLQLKLWLGHKRRSLKSPTVMLLSFWTVCTLKNREKWKLLKLVALIWLLRQEEWGGGWNESILGKKWICVLCLYSVGKTHPGWLKAESAVLAEWHIYKFCQMPGSPVGRCLPNPYSSSTTAWQKLTAFSVFFTTWKEKNNKHTIMFFKGQSEVLWWDARWVHCTFPLQNRWIPVWPPFYGLREKLLLTIVPSFTEALPPELLEGIHTPPTCVLLLQPFKLEWHFSRVGKVEISSRCGLMHLIMQWSL